MNNKDSKNFLLIANESAGGDFFRNLFPLCFKYAQKSKTVLHLSFKTITEFSGIDIKYSDKETLKKIIFMYIADVENMIGKLLELQSWSIVPHLIILDCYHLQDVVMVDDKKEWPKQKICLMIASLLNLAHSFSTRLQTDCVTIVYINPNNSPKEFLQLLIDLYYYKTVVPNLENLSLILGLSDIK